MRVALVGCGAIGRKRVRALRNFPDDDLVLVADIDPARASALAAEAACDVARDWQAVVSSDAVEIVVVCTTNDWLAPIAIAALEHGKHVLVEKPMARSVQEADAIVAAAQRSSRVVKVGFNHRHHPAIWKAKTLCAEGAIGEVFFVRCRYGHGGRPGYEREWRSNSQIAGGGELLDQGIHGIDLFRWFLGDFAEAVGFTATYVWTETPSSSPPVEDNAFALFRTRAGQIASLHASWTQWKNLFSFEVFGRTGYLIAEGLGGSYGTERLTVGRRRMEGGLPEEQTTEFPGADPSWEAEWEEFVSAIREDRQPLANHHDGAQALRMVAAVYESARTGAVASL